MNDQGSLGLSSDFIDACFEQNLSKEELLDCYDNFLRAVINRKLQEQEVNPCAWVPTTAADSDQEWHIASIFIIFLASSIGVAFPLLAKHHKKLNIHHYSVVLGKCAGTGVLLSCALVHMILPSNESLTSGCVPKIFNTEYPAFAYVVALAAILAMHSFEAFLSSVISSMTTAMTTTTTTTTSPTGDNGKIEDEKEDHDSRNTSPPGLRANDDGDGQILGKENDDHCQKDVEGHDQPVMLLDKKDKINDAKHLSEAYLIEFGMGVHSVLIGLAVGVTSKDDLLALLVALAFHQMFEGVSLGSRLADTKLGVWNEALLGSIFAVSVPIGIAIGMGVYTTLNTNSEAYLLTQGLFDGICGGILLFTGFKFLLEDFGLDMEMHCRGKHKRLMQAGMFVTLWVFAGFMSLIGKYV